MGGPGSGGRSLADGAIRVMDALSDQTDLPQTLVALTPSEVVPAQAQLVGWCQQKILALSRDLREQRSNHRQASKMHWKRSGWANAARKTKHQMVYYCKIRDAAKLGYLIVPNFDVDLIAVRVQRASPERKMDVHLATPEVLPPGKGRYVSAALVGYEEPRTYKDYQGKEKTVQDFHPTDFSTDLDFPVQLVKPLILSATNQAMAHLLFDRVGVVRGGRKSDPIVVGQIINPKTGNRYGTFRNNPTVVSFFVAWWLDLEML